MTATPTACLLIIGNEVLSGRTQDANLAHIARKLGERGIALREARVIPDVPETIIGTVNEVRQKFAHVLTTGGIGPTHDDITSECIAAAFGVPWEKQPEAWARMEAFYVQRDGTAEAFNAARQRMATMPRGATLIEPRVIELCFQTAGIWEMKRDGRMGLPARVAEARWLRAPGDGPMVARVIAQDGGTFDAEVADATGRPWLALTGYRTVAVGDAVTA